MDASLGITQMAIDLVIDDVFLLCKWEGRVYRDGFARSALSGVLLLMLVTCFRRGEGLMTCNSGGHLLQGNHGGSREDFGQFDQNLLLQQTGFPFIGNENPGHTRSLPCHSEFGWGGAQRGASGAEGSRRGGQGLYLSLCSSFPWVWAGLEWEHHRWF